MEIKKRLAPQGYVNFQLLEIHGLNIIISNLTKELIDTPLETMEAPVLDGKKLVWKVSFKFLPEIAELLNGLYFEI